MDNIEVTPAGAKVYGYHDDHHGHRDHHDDTGEAAMTTPPVISVTDEMIAELERNAQRIWPDYDSSIVVLSALLAERAELKRDAERYRKIVPYLSHYGGVYRGVSMPDDYSTSTKQQCDAAIDATMHPLQE